MTAIRAKFKVTSKIPCWGDQVVVNLSAVYSNDPNSENKAFTDATPSGEIKIWISDGKAAAEAFEMGKDYYVDFIPVPSPATSVAM